MISPENETRINNLRRQLHRVKIAKLEQTMNESLADRLIEGYTLRIKNTRV